MMYLTHLVTIPTDVGGPAVRWSGARDCTLPPPMSTATPVAVAEPIQHVEYISTAGLHVLRRLIVEANEAICSSLHPNKVYKTRIQFLHDYGRRMMACYGDESIGPMGHPARALHCTYTNCSGGRLYCCTHRGPDWKKGEPSYICAQGMPSVLRPLLMGEWAHDIDIENCHVAIMFQLGSFWHLWPEHNGNRPNPLKLEHMRSLAEDRPTFIEHVADFHSFPTDAEMHVGYRKALIKPLLLRLMFGGAYDAWMNEQGISTAHRSKRVDALVCELRALRTAITTSVRFQYIVYPTMCQKLAAGFTYSAAERSAFSKVAQHLECELLMAMRSHLMGRGWQILSLVFDGLMVLHRDDTVIDFEAMEDEVERRTQFRVHIIEKPLFRGSTDELQWRDLLK